MKFARKCPICHKEATKRVGKLDFCDTHAKEVRKTGTKLVWTEIHAFTLPSTEVLGKKLPPLPIYRDVPIKVY